MFLIVLPYVPGFAVLLAVSVNVSCCFVLFARHSKFQSSSVLSHADLLFADFMLTPDLLANCLTDLLARERW